jgi:hypothetical protein
MDIDQAAASLHHPVSCHRGIDPPGDEGDDPATGPDGETAGAMEFVEAEKGVAAKDFDKDGKLGVFEIHARPAFFFYRGADFAVNLRRGEGKILIAPFRIDPEGRETHAIEGVEDSRLKDLKIQWSSLHKGEVGYAKDLLDAAAYFFLVRPLAEEQQEPSGEAANFFETEPFDGGDQIPLQELDEIGTISFLERDLVIADEDGGHNNKISDITRFCMDFRLC